MKFSSNRTIVYLGAAAILGLLLNFINSMFQQRNPVVVTVRRPQKRNSFSKEVVSERLSRKSFFQDDLILFYTEFYGRRPWNRVFLSQNLRCQQQIPCELSYDKERFLDARAVIFHGPDRPSIEELRMLYSHPVRMKQIWVFFSMENPLNTRFHEELEGMFNFSMSYRLEADIHFPYRHYFRRKDQLGALRRTNYAENKTKQVAWLVSHCGELRDKLANKLESNLVNLEVGGKCRKFYTAKIKKCKGGIMCSQTLRQYKFYLAFENNFCRDYVTEKYWLHPFENNMIPIVLGGADYKNPILAIPGSYLDVFDFENPKHLADRIKEIDANDTLFNSFFKWRENFEFFSEQFECNESIMNLCSKIKEPSIKGVDFTLKRKETNNTMANEFNNRNGCFAREWLFKMWLHK